MVKRVAVIALLLGTAGSVVPASAQSPAAPVQYRCDGGKSISATYIDGPTGTAPDGRPIPGGRVDLVMSDGRRLSLPQTLSGSGIRYAAPDESIVFWSKGDTAFVEEGPASTRTYANCVTTRP